MLFSDRLECWCPVDIYGGQSVEVLGHVNAQTRKLATGRGPLKLCDDLGSHV